MALLNSYTGQVVRMAIIEGWRSRLIWIAASAIALAFALALFLSQLAIIEGNEIRVAIVSSILRAAAVFVVVAFVLTSMAREASDKVSELLLAQPVPRWRYLLAKMLGYGAVSSIVAIAFAAPVCALSQTAGAFAWTASLACELLIMSVVSVFFALTMTQIVTAFASTAALYLLARSVETLKLLAHHPIAPAPGWLNAWAGASMDAVAMAVPALDRFTQSRWLMEAAPGLSELGDIALQTIIYTALVGAAALFDLYRRNY